MSFKSYLSESSETPAYLLTEESMENLTEVLITFGNRPKFNQVVLLAGGAGSGKGFITKKLMGIDAKTFDVDQIKSQIIAPPTKKINKKILDKYGVDVSKLNLRNPDDVKLLHQINDELGYSRKSQVNFFKNTEELAKKNMLPNVIFDVTMKNEKKIMEVTHQVQMAGYKRENIHIIWIATPTETAIKQNKTRSRVVPEDILLATHNGVSANMNNLMKKQKFQEYLDGFVYIVFNQKDIDNMIVSSGLGGSYVKKALILTIKYRNKKSIAVSEIATKFINKLKQYVPKESQKAWDNI